MKRILAFLMASTVALCSCSGTVSGVSGDGVGSAQLKDNGTGAPQAWGPVPSEAQLYYHQQEMAAFVHYGINSFTNLEWGQGDYTPDLFNIRNEDGTGGGSVDADQWVSVLKDAGFKRLILVAKHHDGFCFWPTSTTEHNVRQVSADV